MNGVQEGQEEACIWVWRGQGKPLWRSDISIETWRICEEPAIRRAFKAERTAWAKALGLEGLMHVRMAAGPKVVNSV